jgi:hypothetical protein
MLVVVVGVVVTSDGDGCGRWWLITNLWLLFKSLIMLL